LIIIKIFKSTILQCYEILTTLGVKPEIEKKIASNLNASYHIPEIVDLLILIIFDIQVQSHEL